MRIKNAVSGVILCIPSFILFATAICLEQIDNQMWEWIAFAGIVLLSLPWTFFKSSKEGKGSEYL